MQQFTCRAEALPEGLSGQGDAEFCEEELG
jgi:hypothetical protein